MIPPVTSSTAVNVAEIGIFCPHLDKNNIEGWRLQEGAVVNITPERPLFLCEQCWHVMRSHVLSSLVREGALAVAKSGILRK